METVAKVVASGLDDAAGRHALIQSFRRSPYSVHKLHFQEYAATPEGQAVVQRGLAATGIYRRDFDRILQTLPVLDFFVAHSVHRRQWTGETPVGVTGVYDTDDRVMRVHFADGVTRTRVSGPEATSYPLIMLHPADRRVLRIAPQPDVPGSVIQDPNDGQVAMVLGVTEADGSFKEYEGPDLVRRFPLMFMKCYEDCGGGGGGGGGGGYPPPSAVGTYWTFFHSFFGEGAGDADIKFKMWYYHNGVLTYSSAYFGDVITQEDYYPDLLLNDDRMLSQTDSMKIEIWELDMWFDDHEGTRWFWPWDNGEIRTVGCSGGCWEAANMRIEWSLVP